MFAQLVDYIQHKRTVLIWKRKVLKEAKEIAVACGINLNSSEFRIILGDVANGIITKHDVVAKQK